MYQIERYLIEADFVVQKKMGILKLTCGHAAEHGSLRLRITFRVIPLLLLLVCRPLGLGEVGVLVRPHFSCLSNLLVHHMCVCVGRRHTKYLKQR